ncbi:MAG: hypothetical protein DRJ56_07560 [Thermoprotei archaeon]|nr:MAG: hypothetical protein DRJ56_07560 [Thermoprotei archaeon]
MASRAGRRPALEAEGPSELELRLARALGAQLSVSACELLAPAPRAARAVGARVPTWVERSGWRGLERVVRVALSAAEGSTRVLVAAADEREVGSLLSRMSACDAAPSITLARSPGEALPRAWCPACLSRATWVPLSGGRRRLSCPHCGLEGVEILAPHAARGSREWRVAVASCWGLIETLARGKGAALIRCADAVVISALRASSAALAEAALVSVLCALERLREARRVLAVLSRASWAALSREVAEALSLVGGSAASETALRVRCVALGGGLPLGVRELAAALKQLEGLGSDSLIVADGHLASSLKGLLKEREGDLWGRVVEADGVLAVRSPEVSVLVAVNLEWERVAEAVYDLEPPSQGLTAIRISTSGRAAPAPASVRAPPPQEVALVGLAPLAILVSERVEGAGPLEALRDALAAAAGSEYSELLARVLGPGGPVVGRRAASALAEAAAALEALGDSGLELAASLLSAKVLARRWLSRLEEDVAWLEGLDAESVARELARVLAAVRDGMGVEVGDGQVLSLCREYVRAVMEGVLRVRAGASAARVLLESKQRWHSSSAIESVVLLAEGASALASSPRILRCGFDERACRTVSPSLVSAIRTERMMKSRSIAEFVLRADRVRRLAAKLAECVLQAAVLAEGCEPSLVARHAAVLSRLRQWGGTGGGWGLLRLVLAARAGVGC